MEKNKTIFGAQSSGETAGPTTDESIEKIVELLRYELSGIAGSPPVFIDADQNEVISVSTAALVENNPGKELQEGRFALPDDSPIHIWEIRIQQRIANNILTKAA